MDERMSTRDLRYNGPMRHPWRLLLLSLLGMATVAILAGSWWLSQWAPVTGKQRLETELRQRLQLDVRIGAMRLSPWQGLLLSDVSAARPGAGTLLLHADSLRIRISPLPLLGRLVVFRAGGAVTIPCRTTISVSGTYHLRLGDLRADATTAELRLDDLAPNLRQRLPRELESGRMRLTAQVTRVPGQPTRIAVQGPMREGVWRKAPLRIAADAELAATAEQAADEPGGWRWHLSAELDRGTIEGLPVIGGVRDLTGTVQAVRDRMTVQRLQGEALGSTWHVEGDLTKAPTWFVEAIVRGPLPIDALASQLPGLQPWDPAGTAQLTVVCRGPLARWPAVEIQTQAELTSGRVRLPGPNPPSLDALAGRLAYDHLTRRLTIHTVSGRLDEYPIAARGSVDLRAQPAMLALRVTADADLNLLAARLFDGPVRQASGPVSIEAELSGPTNHLQWRGQATVSGGQVTFRQPPLTIEQVRGTLEIADDNISTRTLEFRLGPHPVTLSGSIKSLRTAPRLALGAQIPGASAALNAVVGDDVIEVDRADLSLGGSHLRAAGSIARSAGEASEVTVTGLIDPANIAALPWFQHTSLAEWHVEGPFQVQARLSDNLRQWPRVRIVGAVAAERLSVRGVPAQTVRAEIEHNRQQLIVRLLNAQVAGGRVTGEYRHDLSTTPATTSLAADVVRADLAQLTQLVPAWKEKAITGTLSSRVELAGPWPHRQQWKGHGWLQADGHLGDVPVLDVLFKGLLGWAADGLGLTTLRRADLTNVACQWRLADGRISTEDLKLNGLLGGVDPVAAYARGTIGLDRSLDMVIDLELSEQLRQQSNILGGLVGLGRVVNLFFRYRLTGTLDKPVPRAEFSLQDLINQALPRLNPFNQLLGGPERQPPR
jgi:hypothetical protein